MSNATPEWAAFSESILANHMQRLTDALVSRGFRVKRLMPNRFVSWHRERISLAMPKHRTVHIETALFASNSPKDGLQGRLDFTVNDAKANHLTTIARSDALRFGGLPLDTDAAQALLERTLEAQFTPEHIAQLVDQALAH